MNLLKNPYALLVIGIVAILIFLGVYNSFVNKAPVLPAGNAEATQGWTKGGENAAVTIVEYADFQCPACKSYQPIVDQIVVAYGDKVNYTYKYFPLPIHKNGVSSALAAEAAGAQGKFWEMTSVLYKKQSEWSDLANPTATFEGYAKDLGLDVEKFKLDSASDAAKQAVADSKADGMKKGVNYTPYFIVNGERVDNPQTVEAFYALINSKLPAGQQIQPAAAGAPAATSTAPVAGE